MKKGGQRFINAFLILLCVLTTPGAVGSSAQSQTVIVEGKRIEAEEIPQVTFLSEEATDPPFPAPDRPGGMDIKNGEILLVSEQAGRLYVIDTDDGTVIRTVTLPGISDWDPGSYGIAATHDFWWHSDYQRRILYKLDPADGSILAELPMPASYLGIVWDGSNLWGVSPNDRNLYRIDANTGNLLETIPLPSIDAPIDVTWDSTNLWVCERDDLDYHQVDVNGTILRTRSAGGRLGGIAMQNPYVWVALLSEAMLYRYDVGIPSFASDVENFVTASRSQVQDVSQYASDVSTVGDYFLDKLDSDAVELVVDLAFNSYDLLTAGVSWARVGRGLEHIRTPGYEAAVHASWRGWADDTAAKHWLKPLYDAIRNDRQLLFDQMAKAGMRYYGQQIGLETAQEFSTWLSLHLLPGPGTPFNDYLGEPAVQLGDSYQSELLREQDDLLALLAFQDLTPEQIAAYRDDMRARRQAHEQMVNQLVDHRNLLWHSYEKAVEDDSQWWMFWGPLLLKWGVVGGATLLWDGPGFYVASIGTAAVSTIYDAAKDVRALEHDEKMLDQSLRFMNGRVSDAYIEVTHNTVGALNLIRSGDSPKIAGGNASVTAMKSFGHYRLWPGLWWAEESSQLELGISNTTVLSTTYLTSAAYDHSSFWAGTERLLVEGQSLDLEGFTSGTSVVPLKLPEDGVSPDEGGPVDILVLGGTETGIYPVTDFEVAWDPIRLEQNAGMLAHVPAGYTVQDASEAPTLPYPLTSLVSVLPGSTDYQVTIAVVNPFTLTVSARVTQSVPSDFAILDSDGAQVSGNSMIWSETLDPNTGLELRAILRWEAMPGETTSVAGPILAFRDPSTGQGDDYTASAETVPAAWPLDVAFDAPSTWQIGAMVTIPITMTNISTGIAVQGTFTSTVTSVDGEVLWSTEQPVGVSAGETQQLSLQFDVPIRMGYAVLKGAANIGGVHKMVFQEVVYIRGFHVYLPVVLR